MHLFSRNRIRIQHSVCLQPHGFRIRILKSRSGFGLIKQGLSVTQLVCRFFKWPHKDVNMLQTARFVKRCHHWRENSSRFHGSSIYSSSWILSIFGTNDHWHEKACCMCWPLICIFKVVRSWLWQWCPLCNVFSSRSIISIFATNNHCH